MPSLGHGTYVVLRSLQCPGCQSNFFICAHCYRGHRYCGPTCRNRARQQQRRTANARHQRTEPGRLDHNRHQQAYRERLRAGRGRTTDPVTDPSSPSGDSASSCGHDNISPRPLPIPAHAMPGPGDPSSPHRSTWRCSFCRRPGIPLPWLLRWRLWYALGRSLFPKTP